MHEKAQAHNGEFFKMARLLQAALGATNLGNYQSRIVAILITRQYCGPVTYKISPTNRALLGKLARGVHRNSLGPALADVIKRKIVLEDDSGHFYVNTTVTDWGGIDLAALAILRREFDFLAGKSAEKEPKKTPSEPLAADPSHGIPCETSTENSAYPPRDENEAHRKPCASAPDTVRDSTENGANLAGLERRDEEIPPKPPHSTFSAAHYDDLLDPSNRKGAASGLGGNDGNARWVIRAGIGYLALECGQGLSDARAVSTALGRWIDERGGVFDPSRFADAIEIIGEKWENARDPVGLAIAAYQRKAYRSADPGALFRRWCEMRGQSPSILYLPSLKAREDDARALEMAKREKIIAKEQADREAAKARLAAARAAEEAADHKRRQAEAQQRRRFEQEVTHAFRAEVTRLKGVSDGDLREYAAIFHPAKAPAMLEWLQDGRPEMPVDGMAAALDLLRGFDAQELAAKRQEEIQKQQLDLEIAELAAPFADFDKAQITELTKSLSQTQRMSVSICGYKGWNTKGLSLKGMQQTVEGLRALADREAVA